MGCNMENDLTSLLCDRLKWHKIKFELLKTPIDIRTVVLEAMNLEEALEEVSTEAFYIESSSGSFKFLYFGDMTFVDSTDNSLYKKYKLRYIPYIAN